MARMSKLRITTSHKYLYKKLDEFEKDHTQKVKDAVTKQGLYLQQQLKEKDAENLLSTQENPSDTNEPIITRHGSAAITRYTPDTGRKITFDNLDYHQDVHHMSEEHQNIDKHFITSMSTENRVHGNHLSDQLPSTGLKEMENGKCLPSLKDHERQRERFTYI